MKAALIFYGITRGLEFTERSIQRNIITPLKEVTEVHTFGAFYKQKEIKNPRSYESLSFDYNNYELMEFDKVSLLEPLGKEDKVFVELLKHGDFWQDGANSLLNVTMQLNSIQKCWNSIFDEDYDFYFFLRPDLEYIDSFANNFKILQCAQPVVLTPRWQKWGGYNDRFTCTNNFHYAEIIANRCDHMVNFCKVHNAPFHSEMFLKWILDNEAAHVRFINSRAYRVRQNGIRKNESFSRLGNTELVRYLRFHLGQLKSKLVD